MAVEHHSLLSFYWNPHLLSSSDPFCLPGADSSLSHPRTFVTWREMRGQPMRGTIFCRRRGPWFAQDWRAMDKTSSGKTTLVIMVSLLPGRYSGFQGLQAVCHRELLFNGDSISVLQNKKSSGCGSWRWLHNKGKVLNITELYTIRLPFLCHVYLSTIKKNQRKEGGQAS